ncbi:MAG: arylsulfotransferase family protein [Solirubrobacteraceae bacterium]
MRPLGCLLAVLVLCAPGVAAVTPALGASAPGRASAAGASIAAFPIPGARFASRRTQIAFRGVSAARLGTILVTGSRSGTHAGVVKGDSDGQGASFLPAQQFFAGEVVTVRTTLNVLHGTNGSFTFAVATPAGAVFRGSLPPARRVRGDVMRFRSRPDLTPPAVRVTRRSGAAAAGDIFISPQQGPLQNGPMLLDRGGGLVWFKRIPPKEMVSDFRVQSYQGKPVLTWWQGFSGAGVGVGRDVINDTAYHEIAGVNAANGLSADLHEFRITAHNTALITAYFPVYVTVPAGHGSRREIVFDSVVQEIDVPTGLVLFQWDSLDHVPLGDSHAPPPKSANAPLDYFHVNSVEPDRDGSLVISARNTWAAYKVDRASGAVIWTLGGKHSSFKLGRGASFAFQHDVRVRSGGDRFVTLFDDGAGPPSVHKESRGLKLFLDLKHMTATVAGEYKHGPPLLANFEGNVQQVIGGDNFVGWGQQPYFTEFNSRGRTIFDGRFVGANSSYRAYRLSWSGAPLVPPAVAATTGRHATVYASWNGATSVARWRVLGGPSPGALGVVRTVRRRGFETAIGIRSRRYVQVQALDGAGHVLGHSATVRAR